MESRKMVLMNHEPICRAVIETQAQRTDLWTQGESDGGTDRESSIETCILPYVKQIASGELLYKTGSSSRPSVTPQRGGMAGIEREVQEGGDICILMADSPFVRQKQTQHC